MLIAKLWRVFRLIDAGLQIIDSVLFMTEIQFLVFHVHYKTMDW